MKKVILILIVFVMFSCSKNYAPLEVVKNVELDKYIGKWYEIARLPNSFQKDCFCSTAEYSILDNETIKVINRCNKDSINGEPDDVEGKAFVVPNSNNAKLKVQFFWPFRGDYWIIDLDETEYSYAVVGHPSREYLCILARMPRIEQDLYDSLLIKIQQKGFDTSKILKNNFDCQ